MTGAVRIREFVSADQEAMRSLVLEGLEERWGWLDLRLNRDLDDIAATYGAGVIVVACAGGELVGCGVLVVGGDGTAEITRMSVRSSWRRRGIGRLLVGALHERAAARRMRRIVLQTTADWHDARAFYEGCGFTLTHCDSGPFGGGAHFTMAVTGPAPGDARSGG